MGYRLAGWGRPGVDRAHTGTVVIIRALKPRVLAGSGRDPGGTFECGHRDEFNEWGYLQHRGQGLKKSVSNGKISG